MSTERGGPMRSRLGLSALFVASFALTVLAVRPTTTVRSPSVAALPFVSRQDTSSAALVASATPHGAPTVAFDASEPQASPAPTLQELAADRDPAIRLEAQALLGLVNEETTADYQ